MSAIPDSPVVSDVEKQAAVTTEKNTTEALINELGENGAHLLDARLLQGKISRPPQMARKLSFLSRALILTTPSIGAS